MEARDIDKESNRLPFRGVLFELTAAILVGTVLYELLFGTVNLLIIPFIRGLFGTPDKVLGYVDFASLHLYVEFNGYLLQYGRVLEVLGTLVLAAVVVVLLIAYARRGAQQADAESDVEMGVCPECISLIPIAARRCAYCRQQVQPQDTPPGTQI